MGPSDPFTEASDVRSPRGEVQVSTSQPNGVLLGAGAGVVFALLVLLFGAWSAVFVVGLGLTGAALGWGFTRLRSRFDLGGAWQALLRREPDETQH